MKIKTLLLILIFFIGVCGLLTHKTHKELFVIHIHGDWCKTCDKVDPVIHSLEGYFKNKSGAQYIVFDETSSESLTKSKKVAEELGLDEIFEYQRHTGEVLFVNKSTKQVIATLCGIDDRAKYIDITEKLLAGKSVESIDKKPASYKLSKPPIERIKQAKLYVIDIHHNKCGTCAITAPVFEKVAEEYKDNINVSFFTFDLSTPKTIDETRKLVASLGLTNIYNSHKHTGEVLCVDATTKKQVGDSLVAETDTSKYHSIINMILK